MNRIHFLIFLLAIIPGYFAKSLYDPDKDVFWNTIRGLCSGIMKSVFDESTLTLHDELGSGSFSTVYDATCRNGRAEKPCAVKMIELREKDSATVAAKEICRTFVFKGSKHIVQLLGVGFQERDGRAQAMMVMERYDDTLLNIVEGSRMLVARTGVRSILPNSYLKSVFHKIALGLEELHSKNILHLDLKLNNILTKLPVRTIRRHRDAATPIVPDMFIADLGVSRKYQTPRIARILQKMAPNNQNKVIRIGALKYLAPEFFEPFIQASLEKFDSLERAIDSYNKIKFMLASFELDLSRCAQEVIPTAAADIYSLGMLFYVTATGKFPFESKDKKTQILQQLQMKDPVHCDLNTTNNLCLLIKDMLQRDPKKRPTITGVLEHPYFN